MITTSENTTNTAPVQDPATIEAMLIDDDDDGDEELTAPHAPRRPQRNLHYKEGFMLVNTDVAPVGRDVLRQAVTILRREIGEYDVWAVETVDLYDGYGQLLLPVNALGHLLSAFHQQRQQVASGEGDLMKMSALLDAAPTIGLSLDHLDVVVSALGAIIDTSDASDLGSYKRAARVARTMMGLTEAMAAYEREVLIPREQAEAQARKEA